MNNQNRKKFVCKNVPNSVLSYTNRSVGLLESFVKVHVLKERDWICVHVCRNVIWNRTECDLFNCDAVRTSQIVPMSDKGVFSFRKTVDFDLTSLELLSHGTTVNQTFYFYSTKCASPLYTVRCIPVTASEQCDYTSFKYPKTKLRKKQNVQYSCLRYLTRQKAKMGVKKITIASTPIPIGQFFGPHKTQIRSFCYLSFRYRT